MLNKKQHATNDGNSVDRAGVRIFEIWSLLTPNLRPLLRYIFPQHFSVGFRRYFCNGWLRIRTNRNHNLWTEKYSYVGGTSPSIGYHYQYEAPWNKYPAKRQGGSSESILILIINKWNLLWRRRSRNYQLFFRFFSCINFVG